MVNAMRDASITVGGPEFEELRAFGFQKYEYSFVKLCAVSVRNLCFESVVPNNLQY